MGMIANYQAITEKEGENLCTLAEGQEEEALFERIEELQEEDDTMVDIDKMWDVLHFVLTGQSASDPIEGDLLSEAVVGERVIAEENFVGLSPNTRVKEIAAALDKVKLESLLADFSMDKCKAADLYPNIWDYEDEKDLVIEEIIMYFQAMKKLYHQAARKGLGILVSIY